MIMDEKTKTKREIVRLGRYLNEIVTIKDASGNLLHKVTKPVMFEVYPRDIMQLIVGATLLSTPIALTEEVWELGKVLPTERIFLIALLSIVFTSLFVYYNFYRQHLKEHFGEFIKRIVLIYFISLCVSFIVLYLFHQAPLAGTSWIITVKRMVIVAFPASMSAAVADMLK
jgi:uncharacterized membrane protein